MDALSPRRKARAWLLALCCALPLVFSGPAAAQGTHAACEKLPAVQVPGAQKQISACLEDLSTRSLVLSGHTDAADWRALHSQQSRNPERAVPGMQVDGYFPDTSTSNGYHGWNHDAQFVMRLPDHWNGKLVITGAPGLRRQYAPDFLISDWMLARGYAYASTDKGNSGLWFYRDGAAPGDAMAEWNQRVTELTLAAKQVVQQRYGRAPAFTYMTGISNGGYLTRHALEQYPELYDGGVDWEGPNWQTGAPNMLTNLPAALKYYPRYAFGDASAHQKMLAAGFAPGSEPLWAEHYALYWDLTARVFREELDPDFDGWLEAGIPFCASGFPLCDADYNFAARAKLVKPALSKIALNGHIGKPLITVQGDLDTVLPPKVHAEPYLALIRKAGQSALHRYYLVEGGNHVDQLYDVFPTLLRPILPCYRAAFVALEEWVESKGAKPAPASTTVKRPASGDLANGCRL